MNKIIQIGNLVKAKRDNPNRGRLYYGGGISPAIYNFAAGGGHGIFIIETHEPMESNRRDDSHANSKTGESAK